VEQVLLGRWEPSVPDGENGWSKPAAHLASQGVPDHEIEKCRVYCQGLIDEGMRERKIALEERTVVRFIHPDGRHEPIGLSGSRDLTARGRKDGTVLIVDHKTNRAAEGVDVWAQRIQPIAYSVIARCVYPWATEIHFRIGYVNLGKTVEWVIDPALGDALVQKFLQACDDLRTFARWDEWPERINENCQWCQVRDKCHTMRRDMGTVLGALAKPGTAALPPTPEERLIWLDNVEKAVGAMKDQTKAEVLANVQAAGGELELGDYRFSVTRSKKRSLPFPAAWDAVVDLLDQEPEHRAHILDAAASMFTAKVTGADALAKRFPQVAEQLKESMVTVEGEPTVTIKRAKPEV
jgi:hypothetical protein